MDKLTQKIKLLEILKNGIIEIPEKKEIMGDYYKIEILLDNQEFKLLKEEINNGVS